MADSSAMEAIVLLLFLVSVGVGIAVRQKLRPNVAKLLTLLSLAGIVVAVGSFLIMISVGLPGIHPLRGILYIGGLLVASACLLPIGALGLVSSAAADGDSDEDALP